MRLAYDAEADAAYLYLVEGEKAARTVAATNDVNLDFDADGRLIGIEVLDARRRLPKSLLPTPGRS